jgi:NAD+ synthase
MDSWRAISTMRCAADTGKARVNAILHENDKGQGTRDKGKGKREKGKGKGKGIVASMPPLAEKIATWLRGHLHTSSATGFALGLSGGIDSAVVARLCQLAAPASTLGVLLPCHSDPRDEQDAQAVADHFAIPTIRVDLGPAYDALLATLNAAKSALPADAAAGDADIRARLPEANVKPRLRMTTLYFIANRRNYLVAGTGNKSELAIGYFTKYGDGGVDLLPLGGLVKSQVRALAQELGVPQPIIDKPPSAGLWIGQTDEGEMAFTYAELDSYLTSGADSVPTETSRKIERFVRASEHKRAATPIFNDTAI